MVVQENFQADAFVIDHLAGDVVEELVGFSDEGRDRPQKLLLRLRRTGWWQFFLSAFIGHWHKLEPQALADELTLYAGVRSIDYAGRFGLVGAVIGNVHCARGTSSGTRIVVDLDRGTLSLSEVDPSDPHCDSELRWASRPLN